MHEQLAVNRSSGPRTNCQTLTTNHRLPTAYLLWIAVEPSQDRRGVGRSGGDCARLRGVRGSKKRV